MSKVEDFIYGLEGTQRNIVQQLHQLLAEDLGLECKIRYRIPFYFNKSWICYLNPIKPAGIEMVFTRGNELSNDQGILMAKDRKQVRGIEYHDLSAINQDLLLEVIQEAILLDETIPYASKNKGKNKLS